MIRSDRLNLRWRILPAVFLVSLLAWGGILRGMHSPDSFHTAWEKALYPIETTLGQSLLTVIVVLPPIAVAPSHPWAVAATLETIAIGAFLLKAWSLPPEWLDGVFLAVMALVCFLSAKFVEVARHAFRAAG